MTLPLAAAACTLHTTKEKEKVKNIVQIPDTTTLLSITTGRYFRNCGFGLRKYYPESVSRETLLTLTILCIYHES